MDIFGVMGIWMASVMVFHANPLNDLLKPTSKMSLFHRDNILVRKLLLEQMEEGDILIEWQQVATYVSASVITLLCFLIDIVAHTHWIGI